jgi:hypothetical protein
MANLLAVGAGAAGGLEELLARQRADELLKLQQEGATEHRREFDISNQRMIDANNLNAQVRRDALNQQHQGNIATRISLRGIGDNVTPEEMAQETAAGAPSSAYQKTPGQQVTQTAGMMPLIGASGPSASTTTTDKSSPLNEPSTIKFTGTQAQRLAAQKQTDAESKQPTPKSLQHVPVMFNGKPALASFDPESGGFSIGGQDVTGKIQPIPPSAGSNLPIVIQNAGGNGPAIVDRRSGTGKPIIDSTTNQPYGAAPTAGQRDKAQAAKEGIAVLNHLDSYIDNAKDLIGPLGGRISDIEASVGNPDPRISALATSMMLAKMKVDAGIGGMRAAASPQILARWDNILASKMTPENLHAAVKVMREMLQDVGTGSGGHESGGLPKVGDTFNGGKILRVTPVE